MKKLTAMVTGANGTIGFELVKAFYVEGYDLIVTCREMHKDELIDMINGERMDFARIHMVYADMMDEESLIKAAQEVAHFDINVLINNAGALERERQEGSDHEPTPKKRCEVYKKMYQLNEYGPYCLTVNMIPHLLPDSMILNVCSDAIVYGRENLCAYSASKAGLYGATLSMRKDYPQMRIHPVLPGWTRGAMGGDSEKAMPPEYVASNFLAIANGTSSAPKDTVAFCIGPVFEDETKPATYTFPYPKHWPRP